MKKMTGKRMAKLIEEAQLKHGWSRGEIISFFDIHWSTYIRWRKGIASPSLPTYFKCMNKLEKLNKGLSEKKVNGTDFQKSNSNDIDSGSNPLRAKC